MVIVTWGDVGNVPARNVYVHVRGYPDKYPSGVSTVLNATQEGRYEGVFAAGLYDIFVSEVSSVPRCKRVEIKADKSEFWVLKLEVDHDHLEVN